MVYVFMLFFIMMSHFVMASDNFFSISKGLNLEVSSPRQVILQSPLFLKNQASSCDIDGLPKVKKFDFPKVICSNKICSNKICSNKIRIIDSAGKKVLVDQVTCSLENLN